MKTIFIFLLTISIATSSVAQDFLTKGTIEFEMKTNTRRMYAEMLKGKEAQMSLRTGDGPEFNIMKKKLLFNGDKLLYLADDKESFWASMSNMIFTDLKKEIAVFKSSMMADNMVFEDSVRHIRWKIEDETRLIAGFKCRKAVGVIMDSVYVVAFYCPEIIPQGGPEMFSGLPGMILGLAIPRTYTTWFATRVQLDVDDKLLTPPVPEKKKKMLTMAEARAKYRELLKAFVTAQAPDEKIDYQLKGLGANGLMR